MLPVLFTEENLCFLAKKLKEFSEKCKEHKIWLEATDYTHNNVKFEVECRFIETLGETHVLLTIGEYDNGRFAGMMPGDTISFYENGKIKIADKHGRTNFIIY